MQKLSVQHGSWRLMETKQVICSTEYILTKKYFEGDDKKAWITKEQCTKAVYKGEDNSCRNQRCPKTLFAVL
jgi:hypothetical protein